MEKVTASEFQQKIGAYTSKALAGPVSITRHGRNELVLLSYAEYERLVRRDRQALLAADLSAEEVEAIASATWSADSKKYAEEFKG